MLFRSTVSGQVTSFNDASGDITLQLIPEGLSEPAYETTVKGNTVAYSFADVAAGNYTLKVSKANHVTREYPVVVGTEDVDQDIELWLLGDANSNGAVTISDVVMILRVLADELTIENINQAAANVHTAEAEITLADATLILKYLLGEATL